jgi:hypothetical protein
MRSDSDRATPEELEAIALDLAVAGMSEMGLRAVLSDDDALDRVKTAAHAWRYCRPERKELFEDIHSRAAESRRCAQTT